MKKNITPILATIAFTLLGLAANISVYASAHLWSPMGGPCDIMMCQLNVPTTTNNTYYEALGFNSGSEGGGYGGIQATSQGNNFIYAIWDPTNHLPIKSVYSYPNSTVENFGGEGTGLHIINYSIKWTANDWISIVSRNWNYLGHTYYGYWAFNVNRNTWYHIITMDYPVPNVKFNGTNCSFIEAWTFDHQYGRLVNIKEGWSRNASKKTWTSWAKSSFDQNNPAPYTKAYDWGIQGDHFFMAIGGSYAPSSTQTSFTLPASGPNPTLTVGQVKTASLIYNASTNELKATWVNDDSKSPQFSYAVEVFDNPNFTGTAVLAKRDTTPHLRTFTLSTTKLTATGTKYYVRMYITDIFDQKSNVITSDFTVGTSTGISQIATPEEMITLYPNPCQNTVNLAFNTNENTEVILSVYDVSGRTVIGNAVVTANQHTLDVATLRKGLYFVKVCDKNKNVTQYIKLIKE